MATVARFKRLTAAEARTLTRSQLLDRIEVEQAYWHRKDWHRMSPTEQAAEHEFSRILHAAINPLTLIQDVTAYVQGTPGAGQYMDQRPDIPDAPTTPNRTEQDTH